MESFKIKLILVIREEIEKQEAKRKYDKLHAAGKTEEARAGVYYTCIFIMAVKLF